MYAREHCFRLLWLMLLSAPLAAEASDPLYSVTTFGGAGSYASGINNAGQLVGGYLGGYLAGGTTEHAFLYSGSMLLDLGARGPVQLCAGNQRCRPGGRFRLHGRRPAACLPVHGRSNERPRHPGRPDQ